jgi:hypothetical protein
MSLPPGRSSTGATVALGLRWHDLPEHAILIDRSVALGQPTPTKTGKTRTVRLLGPLADTLAAWRTATPRSSPTDLVLGSTSSQRCHSRLRKT